VREELGVQVGLSVDAITGYALQSLEDLGSPFRCHGLFDEVIPGHAEQSVNEPVLGESLDPITPRIDAVPPAA